MAVIELPRNTEILPAGITELPPDTPIETPKPEWLPEALHIGAQGIGSMTGAGMGALAGSAIPGIGTVIGALVGAGLGAAGGETAFNLGRTAMGERDQRTLGQQLGDTAIAGAAGTVGEGVGAGLGALARQAIRWAFRGGKSALPQMAGNIADFEAVGASPSVGQATNKHALDNLEAVLAKTPGGASVFYRSAVDTVVKVQKYVKAKALSLGAAEPTVAGNILLEGIEGHIARFRKIGGQKFEAIGADPAFVSKIDNTLDYLGERTAPIPGAENLSKTPLFSNATLSTTRAALLKDATVQQVLRDTGILDQFGRPIKLTTTTGQDGLPYGALKQMRTRIGEKLTDPVFYLTEPIARKELAGLYANITTDMRAAVGAQGGPAALAKFDEANTFWKEGMDRIEKFLEPLVKRDIPENVFTAVERAGKEGATVLNNIKASLTPDQWNAVAGSILQRLGQAPGSLQDATGEVFNTQTFLTRWNTLLSTEAKDALFGTGRYRQDLEKVVRVASVIRENAQTFGNPSGTAGRLIAQNMMVGGAGGILGSLVAGAPGAALGVASSLAFMAIGANRAARLLTNKTFINWLARSTQVDMNGAGAQFAKLGAIAATSDEQTRQDILNYLDMFRQAGDANAQPVQ